jgi:hypothetical protein
VMSSPEIALARLASRIPTIRAVNHWVLCIRATA